MFGEDYSSKDNFLPPNNSYEPVNEIAPNPYDHYIREDYRMFIERTLSRHSIKEGMKSILELKYQNFDDELRWIVIVERLIMNLYLKCYEIKNQ